MKAQEICDIINILEYRKATLCNKDDVANEIKNQINVLNDLLRAGEMCCAGGLTEKDNIVLKIDKPQVKTLQDIFSNGETKRIKKYCPYCGEKLED